ncbi:G/T mismatch-specific thymine DNA glycosylase [Ooceraea biroi]|uniref:G/T mismatch-specific thymine DNA glycosylase n=1 Tax=Ooceraea biroi TaxID=2015173 RepID=A0A026WLB2_OOCBI|nr:G/T mismatch-specific thymine DNA glycosylase [Ooceraea biroi]
MSSLDLNKLKKRPLEDFKRPKKKVDRFDGLSEEEVQKYTLEDYLEMDLDIVFVGINPSLMAAHRGRYYAGPGNHFYKLLHESGLTPRAVSSEEDYKLLRYGIGLTNIVTRPTRSSADLKRAEIKEGSRIVEEKLKLYKPRIAVFNGKCIYDVFADVTTRSAFCFGLQPERIGDTAIWVTPSSSARCANWPRMVDKLHFYTALKRFLGFLKGEIVDVDMSEFRFEGKHKQIVPSTSKMWRRKNMSIFLHGGRVVNKNTLCQDTSEEDIAAVHGAEFLAGRSNHERHDEENGDGSANENSQGNESRARVGESVKETEENGKKLEKLTASSDVGDGTVVTNKAENKEAFNDNRKESCHGAVDNTLDHVNKVNGKKNDEKNEICISATIIRKTAKTSSNSRNRDSSLDFVNLIKQRLSQKNDNNTD